jgi:lipopolysaccharide export system protein LptA
MRLYALKSALALLAVLPAVLPQSALSEDANPGSPAAGKNAGTILYVSADNLKYDNAKKILIADGNAEVTTDRAVIRAARIIVRDEEKTIDAEGDVRIFEGTDLIYSEKARLRTDNDRGSMGKVTVIVRKGPVDRETAKALTDAACAKSGGYRLLASGERVERDGLRRYRLYDAMFTPCDCSGDSPSWSLWMKRGWFDLDEEAYLLAPVLYVNDVPVLGLPAMAFPLGERRTGFLFPRFTWGRNGFEADNYFYITMGRSADATLEADYIQERGFKFGLETRYAASRNSWGKAYGTYIRDWEQPAGQDNRWSATQQHRQLMGDRFYLDDRINLVSDNAYPNDFAFDIWERETEYMKSDLNLGKAFDDFFLGLSAEYYQDLKKGEYDLFGAKGSSTVQQLPQASFQLVMKEVPRIPLAFSADLQYVHYFDPARAWVDDDGDGRIDPGDSIRRVHRLTVYPTVRVPLNLGSAVKWDSSFSFRESYYATEDLGGMTRNAGYGVVRSSLETEVGRTFEQPAGGPFAALRHSFVPSLEYRQIPFTYAYGGMPIQVDEIDTVGEFSQAMFSVHTHLDYRDGAGAHGRLLDFAVSQGLEFGANPGGSMLSPLGFDISAAYAWFSARAYIGYEYKTGISEVYSNLSLSDPRGDTFSVQYNYLTETGRTHFSQGFEDLFPRRFDPRLRSSGEINNANAGVTLKVIDNLFIGYSTNYSFLNDMLMFQTFSLTYTSPCDCWWIKAVINVIPGQDYPDISVIFDMTRLGSIKG